MRHLSKMLSLIILLSMIAFAGDEAVKSIDSFTLPGSDGQTHSFSDYKDAKAVVVIFVSTKCPVSNSFNERMVELANDYKSKDIVFLGINSNKAEQMDELKTQANTHEFSFIVLKDDNNIVADQFQARVTPEVFVLNPAGAILYHGRIDDAPGADERKSEDLKKALDEIVSGNNVSVAETKAFGCSIKRVAM